MASSPRVYKILLFGSKTSGKTSIINLLTGQNHVVGDSISGATFDSQDLEYMSPTGSTYVFSDTCGFDEDLTFNESNAKSLRKFLRKTNEGYHLIIHVRRIGAVTTMDEANYNFLAHRLFTASSKRMICVNTFAENEDMDAYWRDNKEIFERRNIIYTDGLAICAGVSKNPGFEKILKTIREDSRNKLWKLIWQTMSREFAFYPDLSDSNLSEFFSYFNFKEARKFIKGLFDGLFSRGTSLPPISNRPSKTNPAIEPPNSIPAHRPLQAEDAIFLDTCLLLSNATKFSPANYEETLRRRGLVRSDDSDTLGVDPNAHSGYVGVIYGSLRQKEGIIDEIVFAHRGTQFDQPGNIVSDLQIALGEVPFIINDAKQFVEKAVKMYEKTEGLRIQAGVTRIVHVGFSLGGAIAAWCVILNSSWITKNYSVQAVTIDAPGLPRPFPEFNARITNYVTEPNLVNTCHRHVGPVYHLQRGLTPEQDQTMCNSSGSLIKEIEWTVSVHNLTDLINESLERSLAVRLVREGGWPQAEHNLTPEKLDQLLRNTLENILNALASDRLPNKIDYRRSNRIVYADDNVSK